MTIPSYRVTPKTRTGATAPNGSKTPSHRFQGGKALAPQHLEAWEQLVYTNGCCGVFVMAARRLMGGVPTVLVATDPRQLKRHDHPPDEPLDVHVFLQLPDGTAVDAEGRRSKERMARSFGVKSGYAHRFDPDPDGKIWNWGPNAKRKAEMEPYVEALYRRLVNLGWGPNALPSAEDRLATKSSYRAAQAESEIQWPLWEARVEAQRTGVAPTDSSSPRARRL